MEEGTTIVKLGGQVSAPEVVSFEEAFGEHSNASGKRRKNRRERRQEKKLTRIANKSERKSAKHAMRQTSMEEKQGKRSAKHAIRHQRRAEHKQARVDRRAIGQGEDEYTPDESTPASDEAPASSTDMEQSQDQGESSDEAGTIQDYAPGTEPEESSQDDSGDDSGDEYGDEGDDSGDDSGDEQTEGFDGDLSADGAMADIKPVVNPRIADLTNRIEWNKELICRMRLAKSGAEQKGESTAIIEGKINGRIDRVKELEKQLEMYSKITGGSKNQEIQTQIANGRKMARERRMKLRNPAGRPMHGGNETPVQSKLNPEFGDNRIEVPASSNASGTGIIALDNADDYDGNNPTTIELKSNASGKEGGVKFKHIAIGVGVAIAGIILYNKYFKKK